MWKGIGKAYGWKHPKAPSVKHLWKDRATDAVLEFLRDTQWVAWPLQEGSQERKRETTIMMRTGRAHLRL